ncbi:MAG TPA: HYR domain-containing protein [Cyclobacteriaceae bacterium]|nr:HYR domain-containing protein [Cyclobacteriaceae bacterium]
MDDVCIFIAPRKSRKYLLAVLLTLVACRVMAQNCNCPLPASCGACAGGINGLTLRYDGTLLPVLVTALDGINTVYSGLVNPGANFSFKGSLPDGAFVASQVTLAIDGIYNAVINTSCGSAVFVNSSYGSFTVISGTSKTGGPLCCASSSIDKIAPVISNCPSDITASTGSAACSAAVSWTPPTATDNCSSATITSTHSPGAIFPLGTTKVTYTATDVYGNTATCSFNILVNDKTPPVINNCPANIAVTASLPCQGTATWTAPTATDVCSAVVLTASHATGATFPVGQTIVTYTAKDNAGNSSICTFTVTVEDKTPPVIENCPNDISVPADAGSCQAKVQWTEPTFTDNCAKGELTSSHLPGDVFPVGTTPVEYKATDIYGNASYCNFDVVVTSNDPPVITGCPGDIRAEADESGKVSVSWTEPTASSPCGDVTLTSSHSPGDFFSVGSTKVEYTATDDSGVGTTCTFNITVAYKEVKIEVVELVTPNGDGVNDEWIITDLDQFTNNRVTIFDRWGNVIYQASGYDNESVVWKGENSKGSLVPTGTYYYTIEVDYRAEKVKQTGFIELVQ